MPNPFRTPFGALAVPFDALPRIERIRELRECAGRLQASNDPVYVRLGEALAESLRTGRDLAAVLGISAPANSRRTPAAIFRAERIGRLLSRLRATAGSNRKASRMLRGALPTPSALQPVVDELRALGAPCSARSIDRACGN